MNDIIFDRKEQHFRLEGEELVIPKYPLTVTLQITRKCNLHCIYCSEPEYISDPSLEQIKKMLKNLQGVNRIIISGGEPTLRTDLITILEICRKNFDIVALASNGINIDSEMAKKLSCVNYVDVTIDGPREIHDKIRGEYDQIIHGLWNLKQAGREFSIVMVLLEKNKEYVSYVAQIADVLGAKKLKILSPVPKGRGMTVVSEKLTPHELREFFYSLKNTKEVLGGNIRITLTDWEQIKEGHALLIHPNGDVVASPVWSKRGCIEPVGNVLKDPISKIWKKYPYKENHIKKYLEKTLMVC
jgi:MoaA/NifB/PqqE/SkfB family radical SAM enzyme